MASSEAMRSYYDKYQLQTVIVLVILPVLLAISNFFGSVYYDLIYSYFLVYFNNGDLGFQLIDLFQYAVFVIMLVVYPIYPIAFSIEKYFSKSDARSVIKEYEILKKSVYALFPLFLIAIAFIIMAQMSVENPLNGATELLGTNIELIFFTTLGVIFLIFGSALFRIILLNARKEFRFYLAKISFRVISKKEDDVERIRYLIKALNSYNKYIRSSLGLQIKDLKKIYSKIVSDPTLDKNYSIKELSIAFEDKDKLKPIKCISGLLKITDTEQFLIKEPIGKKLEDWAAIFGTIVSTVAAMIGALAALNFPGFSN
jgi:hypothetical protein